MSYRGITRFTEARMDNLRTGSCVIRRRTEPGQPPRFYGEIMIVFDESPADIIKQNGKITCLRFDKMGEARFVTVNVKELAVIIAEE